MAKRSPILGYNHNVKYRGLIFHVQTEDSGLLSPHLFTHLFHGGVIISTRKLVYDSGSSEDAIKGLMQSQHKIVLKDLKGGKFDDKIDVYLNGTSGLEPRTSASATPADHVPHAGPPRPQDVENQVSDPEIMVSRGSDSAVALPAPPEIDPDDPMPLLDLMAEELPPVVARTATPPPIPRASTPPVPPITTIKPRTVTAERKSVSSVVRSNLPPPSPSPDEIDPPTDPDASGAMRAAQLNATVRTPMANTDSAPEISIQLDDELADSRQRTKHDTDVQMPGQSLSDGIPGAIGASPSGAVSRAQGDSIPPLPPPPAEKRPNALAAGALPPARPITRPPSRQQAMSSPTVMSRPVTQDDARSRQDSDAIEVYAPPPPSADTPPGLEERPGQYAQHKRVSQRMDRVDLNKERSGAVPIPAGLAPPRRSPSTGPAGTPGSGGVPQRVQREPTPQAPAQSRSQTPSSELRAPDAASRPERRPRTPTPARISPSGPGAPRPPSSGGGSGGVVMTRPAVIVGAPAKQAMPPRVRKAREEEGRGFGQGLISEKSLDEVILAYLSEDADEK